MEQQSSSKSDGVWIVQEIGEDEGRVLALCASVEEAEAVTDDLAELYPDLRYAFFPFGYCVGKPRPS